MSRLFALLAVAVIAFLCAPHPVNLKSNPAPSAEPSELEVPDLTDITAK